MEAVDSGVGHMGAKIVPHIHLIEAGGAPVPDRAGLGSQESAPGGSEEGDGHVLGDGVPLIGHGVGGDGIGEVRQREDDAAQEGRSAFQG